MRKSLYWQNKIQNANCYYCQKILQPQEVTMDHIVPISRGGKTSKGNVVVSCKDCNSLKKDLTAFEWVSYLASLDTGSPTVLK